MRLELALLFDRRQGHRLRREWRRWRRRREERLRLRLIVELGRWRRNERRCRDRLPRGGNRLFGGWPGGRRRHSGHRRGRRRWGWRRTNRLNRPVGRWLG